MLCLIFSGLRHDCQCNVLYFLGKDMSVNVMLDMTVNRMLDIFCVKT